MQKKYNRFKTIKIIKKRKVKKEMEEERRKGKKKKQEYSTELQVPDVEAEVYKNNKKCD